MKSDRQIQREVFLELQNDRAIDSEHIGVSVVNGIVTLSGTASRYIDKYKAEKRVLSMIGVRGVVEKIEVNGTPNSSKRSHQLAEAAAESLRLNSLVPETVKVTISSGNATLSGTVSWAFEKKAAMDTVRHLYGIVDVNDEIQIEPRGSPSSADIQDRIKKALLRAAGEDAKKIVVDVKDGKVTLNGVVSSAKEFKDAKWAAWSAPGVKEVENKLMVGL